MPEIKTVENVHQFVDLILQTKIAGGREWIECYIKSFKRPTWESFLLQGVTPYCVNILIQGIRRAVMMSKQEINTKVLKGLDELSQEIKAKATDAGIFPQSGCEIS